MSLLSECLITPLDGSIRLWCNDVTMNDESKVCKTSRVQEISETKQAIHYI